MPDYAIHDGEKVLNIVDAPSKEIAESVTKFNAIEISDELGPWIGWEKIDDQWAPPSPYPSWIWNGTDWESPVEQPSGDYYWDEDSISWEKNPPPYPSWLWNGSFWEPPITDPRDGSTWDEQTLSWVSS